MSESAVHPQPTECCLCGPVEAEPIAVGEDFGRPESRDLFLAVRCSGCGLVYLDPAPPREHQLSQLRSAPLEHAPVVPVERDQGNRRLRAVLGRLPADARVLALRDDTLDRHTGAAQRYDAVLFAGAVEETTDPVAALRTAARLLGPAGRLLVLAHNTSATSFRVFGGRHWIGYDFPRRRRLVNGALLRRVAVQAGLEVATLRFLPQPTAWTGSARRLLQDWDLPIWMERTARLLLPFAFLAAAGWERLAALGGRGSILVAALRPARPEANGA